MVVKISYVLGDIISDYSENPNALIVQQNNCTARKLHPGSLAHAIVEKFPKCDPYSTREGLLFPNLAIKEDRAKMGDILIFDNGPDRARVACLFAQYKMGTANSQYYMASAKVDKEYKSMPDDNDARFLAFGQCLEKLSQEILKNDKINTIVFPEKIGCNRAGGNWSRYRGAIEAFASEIENVEIKIVRRRMG